MTRERIKKETDVRCDVPAVILRDTDEQDLLNSTYTESVPISDKILELVEKILRERGFAEYQER